VGTFSLPKLALKTLTK